MQYSQQKVNLYFGVLGEIQVIAYFDYQPFESATETDPACEEEIEIERVLTTFCDLNDVRIDNYITSIALEKITQACLQGLRDARKNAETKRDDWEEDAHL